MINLEKFLVADGNAALVAGGTALIHPTTGVYNLADGQLGIFSTGKGSLGKDIALSAGMTIADAPEIYIAQGTANSANPKVVSSSFLPIRALEKSVNISAKQISEFKGKSYAAPTHDVNIIGRKDGTVGEINVDSSTRFQLTLKIDGRMVDFLNGRNQPAVYPEITTPDFAEEGITLEVRKRDYIVNHLAYQANLESKVAVGNPGGGEFLVLAVSETGTGAGTAISGMSAGVYQIGEETDGSNINYSFSADEITSLKEVLVANGGPLDNTSELVVYNTAIAGDVTTQADVLLVLALDRPLTSTNPSIDRQAQVKSKIDVGLSDGFEDTVYQYRACFAFEGAGLPRQLELWYYSTDGLRKGASEQYPSDRVFEYDSPFSSSDLYDVYTITYEVADKDSGAASVGHPQIVIICIPSADTTTTASFEAVINPYLASAGQPSISL